jgi:hypothetical protein
MAYNSTINRSGLGRNVLQLAASVRDKLHAGGGGNTLSLVDDYWSLSELLVDLNYAQQELWKSAKNLRQDFFLETMASNEAPVRIGGFVFNPTVMKLQAGQSFLGLPPDLSEVKRIRCITPGFERVKFTQMDSSMEEFKAAFPLQGDSYGGFLFDVVGRGSLTIAPIPQTPLDIEVQYMRRLGRMKLYSTGTVKRTAASATVVGTGTTWAGNIKGGAQILFGTTGALPTADPNEDYDVIATIPTDTSLGMFLASAVTDAAGLKYYIADVPELELENDEILVAYAVSEGFAKGSSPNLRKAKWWRDRYGDLLNGFKTSFAKRQLSDHEFVEEYLAGGEAI